MIDISFKMNGRKVRPDQIAKELEKAVLESAKKDFLAHVRKQTSGIRDPNTGAAPRFRIKGNRLDRLSVEIIGSEDLVRLVEERLR